MGAFKKMSTEQTEKLDDLLSVADEIIETKGKVIQGNNKAAALFGTAMGGGAGAAIASGAGTIGILGATAGLTEAGAGMAGLTGVAVTSSVIWPVGILAIIGAGIGYCIGKNNKKVERQKQVNYIKQITEKMEQIYQKYEVLEKELKRIDKEKDDIIREQKEKLAEYEVIFEALRKQRDDIEKNLSFE